MQDTNYTLDPIEEDNNHADGSEEHRLLDALMRDLDRLQRMSEAATKSNLKRLRRLRRGSKAWLELRNRIVEGWTGFAVWIASRFASPLDIADRIQIAALALVRAVEDIDPDSIALGQTFGEPKQFGGFAVYAKRAMENALLQAVAKQTRPVSLDYATYHGIQTGRRMRPTTRQRFLDAWEKSPVWVDEPLHNADGSESEETRADYLEQQTYEPPDAGMMRWDDEATVKQVMEAASPPLTEDERAVISLRFGFVDGIEHSIREIAQAMNLSLVRARSLRDSGMKKLKRGQGITAAEVGNLERSAIHKMKTGAGIEPPKKRFLTRATVKAATCHPARPALSRGRNKGKCSACALRAFRRSQKPTCGHPDRKLAAQGKCSQCYRQQLTVHEPRTCGHSDAPYGARGLCRSCFDKRR
jgi:RNA polymerase sigma factor (sigma-70 family)